MSSWVLWLCAILLLGSCAASDVPFVFDEKTSGASGYTSLQIEQASTSSSDLKGVPSITQIADNEILAFPVVGGGSAPGGTTEKRADDLRKLFDARVEPLYPKVSEEAMHIGLGHPGDNTIEQVSAIFSYMLNGDSRKKGWGYVHNTRGVNNFFYANETLMAGENADPPCVGGGGCADFAILMSALVESLGGTTRIILAHNNTSEGHAFAEVYVGRLNSPDSQVDAVINWLRQEVGTDKIFVNINTSTKDVWLNLDWWRDERGTPHPGGPFYQGDKNIVLYIRENYPKSTLNLPEKSNKPPKLISLIPDKSSPQDAETTITWTAKARDQEDDQIFYKFFLGDNPVTNWTKNNKWVWDTTNDDVGENQIEVRVRDGKHTFQNGFDDHKDHSFNITEPKLKPTVPENQPPAIVSLVSDKSSPQEAGTIITWTAEAKDPENDQMLYKFFQNNRPATDWQSKDQWTWDTTKAEAGDNTIEVQVRDGKHASQDSFDGNKSAVITIVAQNQKPSVAKDKPESESVSIVAAYTPEQKASVIDGMHLSFQSGQAYDKVVQGQDISAFNALVDPWNAWVVKNFGNDMYATWHFAKITTPIKGSDRFDSQASNSFAVDESESASIAVAYTPEQKARVIDGVSLSFQLGQAYDKAMQGQDVPAFIAIFDQWKTWVVKNFRNDDFSQICLKVLPDVMPGV